MNSISINSILSPKKRKPKGYYSENVIIENLKQLKKTYGYIPKQKEIRQIDGSLEAAIEYYGGLNFFRSKLGEPYIRKPKSYWSDETIIKELNIYTKKYGHFPGQLELSNDNGGLSFAIVAHGGFNRFKRLMNYPITKNDNDYWTEDIILDTLNKIIAKLHHFPTQTELRTINSRLLSAINKRGGLYRFRSLCGFAPSKFDKYISETASYYKNRGYSAEKIVKKIITTWCKQNNKPLPTYNKKLELGCVIEFVCNTSKKIGIDVTVTKNKDIIVRKYRKKQYQKYLDELWIVVFEDVYTKDNYIDMNNNCPHNVRIMSINMFITELKYSVDIYTQKIIDVYKQCTFNSKQQFIESLKKDKQEITYWSEYFI